MHRFSDDFNDETTARLVALLTDPIFIKAQIAAYSDDFELPEHYTPRWITNEERKALSSDTFVEHVNGKLTVYKNSAKDGFDAYVTKDEISNNPAIKQEVTSFLETIENYRYELIEFEGKKFVRVKDENDWTEPRNIIMTEVFRSMMQERYGNSLYVIITVRGVLFAFSVNEDPYKIMNDILLTDLGIKDREFEVLLIENESLSNVFKLITYLQ